MCRVRFPNRLRRVPELVFGQPDHRVRDLCLNLWRWNQENPNLTWLEGTRVSLKYFHLQRNSWTSEKVSVYGIASPVFRYDLQCLSVPGPFPHENFCAGPVTQWSFHQNSTILSEKILTKKTLETICEAEVFFRTCWPPRRALVKNSISSCKWVCQNSFREIWRRKI